MKLANQVAIITGGGGAIGRAIGRQLAEEGATVVLFDLFRDAAEKAAADINALGQGRAVPCVVNVSAYADCCAAVDKVVQDFGRIDILVNCAGGSAREKMKVYHEQTMEVVNWMLGVNLCGPLHCIHAVSKHMVKAKSGRIINITSIVALNGKPACTEYAAAKGAIIAATKCLAMELGPFNITVNCVAPGLVERRELTPQLEATLAYRHSCVNRACRQDDIANMVRFLALPESDYITGQNIAVDGGRSLGLKGDDLRKIPDR